MASFNKVIIAGNLTKDPEYKSIGTTAVCRLNLASNRQYKNKQGSLTQEVCFVDIDVWGVQAENCNKYLQKGSSALVEGRLKLDTWEQDGQARRKHLIVADKVVFLGSNQQASTENNNNVTQSNTSNSNKSDEMNFKDEPPFEDELPF